MDFAKFRDHAKTLGEKAKKLSGDAVEYGSKKLSESTMLLKNLDELEAFILQSKNTQSEEKTLIKKCIVIFAQKDSEFFKHMLYILPVLYTKSFSQNIPLKLADSSVEGLDLQKYGILGNQGLVVFENQEAGKTVEDTQEIQSLVKSLNLDINKAIEEL